VSTVIGAALGDGIGVVALANADAQHRAILNIVVLAARKAFGLEDAIHSPANEPNPPGDNNLWQPAGDSVEEGGAAELADLDLAGTYFNAGYGAAVLCDMHSSSSSCQDVLEDFRSVDESLLPNSTDLFTSWNTVWSTHTRFTHIHGNQYMVFIGTIYPEGYGMNSTPFSTLDPFGVATFVVENRSVIGFGISHLNGIERPGSVEEGSDVWFVKQS
jgi:hypothetical protein